MQRILFVLAASLATACGQTALPAQAITLEGLTLEAPGITFPIESTIQLKSWGHYSDGSKVDLTNKTAWSSALPAIAQVGSSGIVHFAGAGSSRLVGTFEGKVVALTVFSTPATLRSLEVASLDSGGLARGDTRRFTATAHFSDGTSLDVTSRAQWEADGSVVKVSDTAGVLVAHAQGEGIVRARYLAQQSSVRINVLAPRFRSLDLVTPNVVIRPGDMHALSARAVYSDGSMRDVTAEAEWRSSDAAIFALGQQPGVILAHAPGHARITASWNGSTASALLQVLAHHPTQLSFELASIEVARGRSERVSLFAWFDDGSRVFISDSAHFSSSQPGVAEVSDVDGSKGVVTAVGIGSATIRAEFAGLVATYQFEGTAPVLEGLTASMAGGRLVVGQAADFIVQGTWSDGSALNLGSEILVQHGPELVSSIQGNRVRVIAAALGQVNVTLEFGGLVHQVQFEVTNTTITQVELRGPSSTGSMLGPLSGQQRFRAFATYSDGVVLEVSELCNWWVDDADVALMADEPGSRGSYGLANGGTTAVRASFNGQTSTLVWNFAANP